MDFTYNEKQLTDIISSEVILCTFDASKEEELFTREIIKGETNSFRSIANHYNTKYNDPIEFDISLIKKDNSVFTDLECRELNKWLGSPRIPKWGTWKDKNGSNVNLKGLFTKCKYTTVQQGVVGITYTFTSDSPYYWSDLIEKEYEINGQEQIVLGCNSDEGNEYIYPIIILTGRDTKNTIKIINSTDNNNIMTVNCNQEVETFIDCKNCKIYDEVGLINFDDLGWTDIGNIYWFRLMQGNNTIIIQGKVHVKIQYRCPVKRLAVVTC